MNWLGILAAVFLSFCCYQGYRKGFVREAVSLMFMFCSFFFVWLINPYINDFLREETPVYVTVEHSCKDMISGQLMKIGEENQEEWIRSLPLSENIQKDILENNTIKGYQKVAADSFAEYVAAYFAGMITNGLSFMISYFLIFVVLKALARTMYSLSRLPVLRQVNRMAGAGLGAVKGILVIWILLLVLTVFCTTPVGKQGLTLVKRDVFLSELYERDLFVQVFLSFF